MRVKNDHGMFSFRKAIEDEQNKHGISVTILTMMKGTYEQYTSSINDNQADDNKEGMIARENA